MTLTDLNGVTKDTKEEQVALNAVWKQIMDPVLDYCQVCGREIKLTVSILIAYRHSCVPCWNQPLPSYHCSS